MPHPFEQLGPYKLGKKLGQGGMGSVYEGVDTETGRAVAVKVLAPAMAAEEGFRARFEAEIESLKNLKHPNIVRIYGEGEQGGSMFYAMERVEGTSLEDEIRNGRRFTWREVVQIAIKMCKALKLAHDSGIVHRDIKPANILISNEGEIKIADFGIARLFGGTRMTSDGGVLGTAEYMAPEQADGRAVTERCDQYSLGGVMYAMLAGRPPFRANSFVEMLQMQRFSEPDPVRRFAPDTPAELDRIVAQLLAKDPAKRFTNTMMLARALEAMEKGLSVSSARDDFVVTDPHRTSQPHLTGLDPFAATLVPSDDPDTQDGYAIADDHALKTLIHAGKTELPAEARQTPAEPATRFAKVEDESQGVASWYSELAQSFLTPQSFALVAALVAVLGIGWYLLRPASADQLYEHIAAVASGGDLEKLKTAEPAINEFLNRFPDDTRTDEVEDYKSRLDLARRGRNARLTAKKLNKLAHQSPVERCYIEASTLAATNPEAAIGKLQAIVDLYGGSEISEADGAAFVEIARQDLERLQKQIGESAAVQLKLLSAQAEKAESLAKSDPAAAKKLWQSIVELYADKPWAKELVEKARQALAQ